jgi:hypothetical protein
MSLRAKQSACVALSVLVALLLAACGGSFSSSSSSAEVTQAPAQVAHPQTPVPKFIGVDRDKVGASRTHPVEAREQAGTVDDEVNSSGRKALNPCTLVSRAEVQAVLHQQVGAPVDAPQGPTCIYTPQHTKGQITVAVESLPFSQVKPQAALQARISLVLAGHATYCGNAGGRQMLVVPLAENRFLTVTASCPIAASLAAKALGHIA